MNDGGIFISVTGGTNPYTYLWSNGTLIQDNDNLVAGVYSLILTDQLLCRDTSYYTITQPALLQDSVTTNSTSCGLANGSATIYPYGGTSAYGYLWSNGQTGQTVTNLATGTYTVTVTDANLCSLVETVSIGQIPVQVISTDSIIDPTCNGSADGAIYISVTSGEAPYTYLWSNSDASGQDIQGLSAGVYTVTVTDNNSCSLTQAFTVTDPLPLTDSTNVLSTTCGQSNGTATIFPIGGSTPYSYLWSTNSTSQTIFGLASGVYTVTVTDSLGCTLTVNIPVGALGGPVIALDSIVNVSCNGNSDGGIYINVTSGSSPYLYSWSNSQSTEDISGLIFAITYSVTVTDQSNCQQLHPIL